MRVTAWKQPPFLNTTNVWSFRFANAGAAIDRGEGGTLYWDQ